MLVVYGRVLGLFSNNSLADVVGSGRLCSQFATATIYPLAFAACPRVFSFAPTLPVSGRGGRALNLGNRAAEVPATKESL
jgi:hypothetical protein